jgi:para-nitrobenzyl esterase
MSVGTLLGCPSARGLFQRAIAQSGACQAIHHDRESSAAVTAAVLSSLGLDGPDLRKLREIPAEKLLAAQQQVSLQMLVTGGRHLLPLQPVVDGRVLPRHPFDEVAEGNARGVSTMVGTTRDEWRLFGFMDTEARQLDADKIAARTQTRLPHADGARIVAGYREGRDGSDWTSLWMAMETDRVFRLPAIRLAEAQAAHAPDTYMYLFTWEAPGFGGLLGACHAVELPFVFGCTDVPGVEMFLGTRPEARALVDRTMDAWLAFARTGSPGHPGLPDWPRYDAKRRATMELGAECRVVDDPKGAERALWDRLL